MRPDVARTREPLRIVNGDLEGERYKRTDTGGSHQKATDRIHPHDAQDLPVQCGTMLKHGIAGLEQRVYGSCQQRSSLIASRTAASNAVRLSVSPIPSWRSRPRIVFSRATSCDCRGARAVSSRPCRCASGDLTQTGRYLLTRIKSAMPRASLRSFLLRKPACSAAAACRASMLIAVQPYRCSAANSQASVQT